MHQFIKDVLTQIEKNKYFKELHEHHILLDKILNVIIVFGGK